MEEQTLNDGNISNEGLKEILSKYGTINYEQDGITIKGITTKNNYEILLSEIWIGTTQKEGLIVSDENWDSKKGVNIPQIEGTGLTAGYWEESKWIELNKETSTKEEWDKWYNYENKEWANAVTKNNNGDITGYWVWIPRYEYYIDSDNKTIDIKFIPKSIKSGIDGYQTDENTGLVTTIREGKQYIIHPAFIDDSSNIYANGGWDKELEGFWVSKYVAGYQNGTIGEESKEVQRAELKYTSLNNLDTSFLDQKIVVNSTKLPYPVFKANTYAYNLISTGDAFLLSQEIYKAKNMYGLNNIDSHLQKNSEWGAVAYLTHSQYGVNGNATNMNEVSINNKNLNNTVVNVYAVTSYGMSNIPNDVSASSTKNITGVFDLNGCVSERTATFYKGGNVTSAPQWHSGMATSNTKNSTKYLTLYEENNKKGDATNETANWNSDVSTFIRPDIPIFIRGGACDNGNLAGIFAFNNTYAGPHWLNGFRICLTV